MICDRPLYVAIPTIGESHLLKPLVDDLLADSAIDHILLLINQPDVELDDMPASDRLYIALTDGPSIYPGWNTAIRSGALVNAWLAILNDDIAFMARNTVSQTAQLLCDYPQYVVMGFDYTNTRPADPLEPRRVHGSYRMGGIGGFAFMVDTSRCPEVDEQFEWWGGDDDLFFQVEDGGGRLGIATGLTVSHVAETTASKHAWTFDARDRDRERLRAKWGKTW